MTAARRNILRPLRRNGIEDTQRARRQQRLQTNLERATAALVRWQKRLKRAFTTVVKYQQQITRLNRQLQQLDP